VFFALNHARPGNQEKIPRPDANITDLKRRVHFKASAKDSHASIYPCESVKIRG